MKYIRTKDGIYDKVDETLVLASLPPQYELTQNGVHVGYEQCRKCILADTIEELVQIGDIVVYWTPSDDKEHCVLINYDTELYSMKYNAITKLLIPVGEDYKCVAKGYPAFNLIKGRRYLVSKGELELL